LDIGQLRGVCLAVREDDPAKRRLKSIRFAVNGHGLEAAGSAGDEFETGNRQIESLRQQLEQSKVGFAMLRHRPHLGGKGGLAVGEPDGAK
jgi:hypothetical protein